MKNLYKCIFHLVICTFCVKFVTVRTIRFVFHKNPLIKFFGDYLNLILSIYTIQQENDFAVKFFLNCLL